MNKNTLIEYALFSIAIMTSIIIVSLTINDIVKNINDSKIQSIITTEEQKRETLRYQYSFDKNKREEEHKKNIEILNLMQKFEDSNRAMTYENDYQLKKIEFKGTVFETCSQYYEKSIDFIECVRNILRNDLDK